MPSVNGATLAGPSCGPAQDLKAAMHTKEPALPFSSMLVMVIYHASAPEAANGRKCSILHVCLWSIVQDLGEFW